MVYGRSHGCEAVCLSRPPSLVWECRCKLQMSTTVPFLRSGGRAPGPAATVSIDSRTVTAKWLQIRTYSCIYIRTAHKLQAMPLMCGGIGQAAKSTKTLKQVDLQNREHPAPPRTSSATQSVRIRSIHGQSVMDFSWRGARSLLFSSCLIAASVGVVILLLWISLCGEIDGDTPHTTQVV